MGLKDGESSEDNSAASEQSVPYGDFLQVQVDFAKLTGALNKLKSGIKKQK